MENLDEKITTNIINYKQLVLYEDIILLTQVDYQNKTNFADLKNIINYQNLMVNEADFYL